MIPHEGILPNGNRIMHKMQCNVLQCTQQCTRTMHVCVYNVQSIYQYLHQINHDFEPSNKQNKIINVSGARGSLFYP